MTPADWTELVVLALLWAIALAAVRRILTLPPPPVRVNGRPVPSHLWEAESRWYRQLHVRCACGVLAVADEWGMVLPHGCGGGERDPVVVALHAANRPTYTPGPLSEAAPLSRGRRPEFDLLWTSPDCRAFSRRSP